MPFTLFQGGSSLQIMDTSGNLTTLTLPTGVTIDSSKTPRFAIFGRYIVMVNSPTRPITIDADGIVRPLCPLPPATPAVTTGTDAGSLSGTYLVKYSYVILDSFRRLIAESPLSPASATVTIASKLLRAASLALSPETISAIRLYRTATNGSTYFQWVDLDGNTQTSVQDDLADASLPSASVASLGAPPKLTHIGEFRERLFGVSTTDIDALRYTEASRMFAWPSTNRLIVPREGNDDRGITGILARRDALAIGRQNSLVEVKGDNNDNFRIVKLSQEIGIEGDDSTAQYRDTFFFLAKDGLYSWDNSGVNCISDGQTRAWFTTDTYFNRSRFRYAVGRIDPLSNKYQLLLSAAGSTNLDRWIEYDIVNKTFWGPHKTDDFTPSWMTTIIDGNNLAQPVIGSSAGFFYKEQETRTDGTATGIAFDVEGKFHDMNTPDIFKFFGELSLISKVQAAGTLSIVPAIGGLDSANYYRDTVLNGNPVAYYRLDDAATPADDESPNGFDGTIAGTPTFGAAGALLDGTTAISFSGDDEVTVADNVAFRPTTISVEAWIYPTNYTAFNTILAKASGSWTAGGYGLFVTSGATEIKFFINSYLTNYASATVPTTNTYTHVVGTYDGVAIKLYINGALVSTTPYTTAITHDTGSLKIGNHGGGAFWQGRLDEVAIYGRAISPDEVLQHYRLGVGTTISADMTKGRQRLRRLGVGLFCKLTFQHSTAGQDVELYGYELPFHEIGRR